MKRIQIKVAALLLGGVLLCSSCIGSFSLFNSYEKWQCNMTSNKIVNGVVGFFLQPFVGSVCLLVDAVVLNTIEFWSGSNPMADAGKVQQVQGSDGRYYAVTTLKDGYEVKAPDGQVTRFTHHADSDSWTMTRDGVTSNVDLAWEN